MVGPAKRLCIGKNMSVLGGAILKNIAKSERVIRCFNASPRPNLPRTLHGTKPAQAVLRYRIVSKYQASTFASIAQGKKGESERRDTNSNQYEESSAAVLLPKLVRRVPLPGLRLLGRVVYRHIA